MNHSDLLIRIIVFDDKVIIKNCFGVEKIFPRCGITRIEAFILEMAKLGELDELLA